MAASPMHAMPCRAAARPVRGARGPHSHTAKQTAHARSITNSSQSPHSTHLTHCSHAARGPGRGVYRNGMWVVLVALAQCRAAMAAVPAQWLAPAAVGSWQRGGARGAGMWALAKLARAGLAPGRRALAAGAAAVAALAAVGTHHWRAEPLLWPHEPLLWPRDGRTEPSHRWPQQLVDGRAARRLPARGGPRR